MRPDLPADVVKAFTQAKESTANNDLVTDALKHATSVPLSVAERAHEIAQWAEKLAPITNPKMASDLGVSKSLARAAIEGALANVEINLEGLQDPQFVRDVREKAARLK